MSALQANGLTLGYDRFGDAGDEAVLLISGLGVQRLRWADSFCERLAAQGFHVIRFDNRDAGESTHLCGAPVPDFAALVAALNAGRMPEVPYTLHDMANDAVGLLDGLGVSRAHVVGRSMGGMVAQLLASTHERRVRSLVSIMSQHRSPRPAGDCARCDGDADASRPGPARRRSRVPGARRGIRTAHRRHRVPV